MGRKKPYTPRSRVRSAIRQLWLKSRERAATLKMDKHTCIGCKQKASRAKGKEFKVEVHHLDFVDWEEMIDIVYERILVNPDRLVTLCKECHGEISHKEEKSNR